VARDIADPFLRFYTFCSIVRHLPADASEVVYREILDGIQTIKSDASRSDLLVTVARGLPKSLGGQAMRLANRLRDSDQRLRARVAFARLLPKNEQKQIYQEALEDAKERDETRDCARALGSLVSRMPFRAHAGICKQVIELLEGMKEDSDRIEALQPLLFVVPRSLRLRTLGVIRQIRDGWWRSVLLNRFAEDLPNHERKPLIEEALASATQIADDASVSYTLSILVDSLPVEDRGAVTNAALEACRRIHTPLSKSWLLAQLVEKLPKTMQSRVAREAIDTARSISDADDRVQALRLLAQTLPEPFLDGVLTTARESRDMLEISTVFEQLIIRRPQEERWNLVDEEWLEGNWISFSGMLAACASDLEELEVAEAFEIAWGLEDEIDRGWALGSLASPDFSWWSSEKPSNLA